MVLRACPVLILLATLAAAQGTPPQTKYSDTCEPGQFSKEKPCATAPHATYIVDPEYPEDARQNRLQGTVELQVKVSKDGRPTDIKVLKSLGHGFDESAMKAVATWKYRPATLNGEPVEVWTKVEVNFRLSNQQSPPLPGPVSALDASKLFAAASSAHAQHDCTTAVQLATRVTQLVPNHYEAWNLLGLCYIETGDLRQAEAALKRQIEVAPDHLYAYNNLGRVYLRTHEYDRAIALFRHQLELNPQDRHAHQNLGHALRFEKKCNEAVAEYQIAASMRIGDPLPHIGLAECYLDLGDNASALAEINRAVPFISDGEEWNELAWTMAEHKLDLPHAEQYARSAIAIDSAPLLSISMDTFDPRVYWKASHLTSEWDTVGWILYLEGKREDAEKYLLPAWQWSQDPTVAAHLATLYESWGKDREAASFSTLAVNGFKDRPELMATHAQLFQEAQHRLVDLPAGRKLDKVSLDSCTLPNLRKAGGSADFAILQDVVSHSASARWISGSAELREFQPKLAGCVPGLQPPGGIAVKVVRAGTLTCDTIATSCAFQLASLHQAMAANQRKPSPALVAVNTTPREFSSPTLGITLTLPEGWKNSGERAGNFNHSAMVWFSKLETIAHFLISRERVEAGAEDFEHIFQRAVGGGTLHRHWSEATVQRNGVSGARFIADYERGEVEFHAVFELFTLGDLHYVVVADAPRDEFARYAEDFTQMFNSLHFAGSSLAENGLK